MPMLAALHRIGPYHHSRFAAVAGELQLHVIETRPQSIEYPWAFQPHGNYTIHQLSGHPHPEADLPLAPLRHQLAELLETIQPQAIISVGWADRTYQQLLVLAHQRRIPVVLISDSRQRDEPRSAAKESLKRQLLRGYSAALVAGQESRAYLEELGFPPAAIFQPWDVVDNAFFEQAASGAAPRQPHFLCVSRLVAKKNHAGLLHTNAKVATGASSWWAAAPSSLKSAPRSPHCPSQPGCSCCPSASWSSSAASTPRPVPLCSPAPQTNGAW